MFNFNMIMMWIKSCHWKVGTDFSSNSLSLDTWTAYNHPSNFVRDCTTTWYTTNDATLEITGLQLEVGDTATSFEHQK